MVVRGWHAGVVAEAQDVVVEFVEAFQQGAGGELGAAGSAGQGGQPGGDWAAPEIPDKRLVV